MIGAVLKLIIFTSMVNRIINTSRNERVTQQVYDTYLQIFEVCTLRHTAHSEAIVQFLPYSAQQVRRDGLHSRGNSVLQIRYATFVACTVPRFNPLWLLPLGLREGQSVCATTTREHTWFEEQNSRGCRDHHTWLAEQSMAGIGLSTRCVPCDEGCILRILVGTCHKLVELLFHFY